jgi:ammonium transporter Rh
MFQNVHVMVFVGFELLMAFLRKYGYGAMAFTLLIGSWAIEWGVICLGYMHNAFAGDWSRVPVSAGTLIDADFAAVAALISYGAVIGKASPTQIILMIGIELILYAVNIQIGLDLNVVDIGGTMYIHTFGRCQFLLLLLKVISLFLSAFLSIFCQQVPTLV